ARLAPRGWRPQPRRSTNTPRTPSRAWTPSPRSPTASACTAPRSGPRSRLRSSSTTRTRPTSSSRSRERSTSTCGSSRRTYRRSNRAEREWFALTPQRGRSQRSEMDDGEIHKRIEQLVGEEQELYERGAEGGLNETE